MNYSNSKSFHLGEILLWEIIYYIVCASGSDIDRRKLCRYKWCNLFRNSSVEKDCWGVVSNRCKNKLSVEIIPRAKNNLMLGLAFNGLGSAYSLPL
ncbi:hypothetical protein RhiirA5_495015 [Rhizophagus irregularis]|uniref:Uncharacterized protein n=1 Tax=Rhizophagus irregularis TaxID=588596 RepID=A0A2N0Q722_9GLOM|nr:hypothetical protein RhiirA5_495015 [Rhizophagus irregularis]CAB5153889.1 unnamed protein product [Rhizophagus irregularis]